MSVIDLVNEVSNAGATLRAEPPDLIIGRPNRISAELKARIFSHKRELLKLLDGDAELVRSRERLETDQLSIAIEADGTIRLIHTHESSAASRDGATVYSPTEMYVYSIAMDAEARQLMRELKGMRPSAGCGNAEAT